MALNERGRWRRWFRDIRNIGATFALLVGFGAAIYARTPVVIQAEQTEQELEGHLVEYETLEDQVSHLVSEQREANTERRSAMREQRILIDTQAQAASKTAEYMDILIKKALVN